MFTSILQCWESKYLSKSIATLRSWVQIQPGTDILDSIVDFILTVFFEITIKSYVDCEISSQMENLLCECISFGGVS